MMRRVRHILFAIIFGSIMLLAASVFFEYESGHDASSYLRALNTNSNVKIIVYPMSQLVEKGQDIRVDILVDPMNNPISAVQFDLALNGTLIDIKNVSEGDILKQNGAKTVFNSRILNNDGNGIIRVWGLIITPGGSIISRGTIASIRMAAKDGGYLSLNLSNVKIGNPEGKEVKVNVGNGVVNIKG